MYVYQRVNLCRATKPHAIEFHAATPGTHSGVVVDDDLRVETDRGKSGNDQLIGLRENLQENDIFHGKIYGFRCRFSLFCQPIEMRISWGIWALTEFWMIFGDQHGQFHRNV